jgi:hypothetical protein
MVETERNMRGEHLVVQSLEVLEDFTGKAARVIDSKIGSVQETLVSVASRADKFYQDAAADGIITPEEKKILKRDFGELRRVYLAILQQAETKGLSDDPRITGLITVYSALYTYLYSTIKVFDDMESNTVITSSDDMNAYYDAYYDAQMFAQAVLTQTALAYVRVLSSLSEPGLSDELGYYGGQLYRYVADEGWQAVSSGDYMGVVTGAASLTETKEGSFFLAGASFAVASYRIVADAGVIATGSGDHIAVSVRAHKGDVWACSGGIWRRIPDRNDWRYVLATNDLIAMGEPISPMLEGHVRDIAETAAQDVAGGTYLGPKTADPGSPSPGDFFLYVGNTTAARKNGSIYKWQRSGESGYAWTELSAEDPASYRNYMDALSDMLREDSQSLETGRFSVVFARSLAAMSAMIDTLMAQTMILKSGGVFKSEGFDSGTGAGFRLSADGVLEAREGIFRGTVFATNGKFSGIIDAITGNLMNINISGNSTFEGDIVSGPITISDDAPPASTLTITPDMTAEQIYLAMNTTFGAASADVNPNLSYANNYQNCKRFSVNKYYQQGDYQYTIDCLTTDLASHRLYRGGDEVANISAYLTKFVSTNKTLRINNLPTTRPTSSGYLWNDNGTVKIS